MDALGGERYGETTSEKLSVMLGLEGSYGRERRSEEGGQMGILVRG